MCSEHKNYFAQRWVAYARAPQVRMTGKLRDKESRFPCWQLEDLLEDLMLEFSN